MLEGWTNYYRPEFADGVYSAKDPLSPSSIYAGIYSKAVAKTLPFKDEIFSPRLLNSSNLIWTFDGSSIFIYQEDRYGMADSKLDAFSRILKINGSSKRIESDKGDLNILSK